MHPFYLIHIFQTIALYSTQTLPYNKHSKTKQMDEEMYVLINRQNVERLYKGVVQNVFYHILESSWCAFDESVLPIGKSSCS